jgi:hypothetical protein
MEVGRRFVAVLNDDPQLGDRVLGIIQNASQEQNQQEEDEEEHVDEEVEAQQEGANNDQSME